MDVLTLPMIMDSVFAPTNCVHMDIIPGQENSCVVQREAHIILTQRKIL